jgi:hypothetical protein
MFYLPPGSMMQLIDGRVLHKDQKTNQWRDNMGVPITEQQLQFMLSFPSFSDDPSGGGNAPVPVAAEVTSSVSLSALFDDIVLVNPTTSAFNTNRTLTITGGPATLRLTFASDGIYDTAAITAYKNDVAVTPNIRLNSGSAGLVVTLPTTFADGDQLKFQYGVSTMVPMNFNVTIEKTAPGTTSVLDVFNCSTVP